MYCKYCYQDRPVRDGECTVCGHGLTPPEEGRHMPYPRTLAALREQENRSWAIADALATEIQTHPEGRVINGEFDRCATWLASQGYEVSPDYLRQMHRTALKFRTSEVRKWKVPFRLYMAAAQSANWTPGLMEQAELNRWTLRQFSEKLTGRRWADDDMEAVRRVMSSPDKIRQVLADPEVAHRVVQAAPTEVAMAQNRMHKEDLARLEDPATPGGQQRQADKRRIEVLEVLHRMSQLRKAAVTLAGLGSVRPYEAEDLAAEAAELMPVMTWLAGLSPDATGLSDQAEEWLRAQS